MMSFIKAVFTKKAYRLLCLTVFILLAGLLYAVPTPTQNQTDAYEDLFFYAQALEQGGAIEQAELEYKRYIFMQDYCKGAHQTQAFENLAAIYAANKRWELAAETIKKAIFSAADNNTSNEQDSQTKIDQLRQKQILYLAKQAEQNGSNLSEDIFIFSYMNLPEYSAQLKQTALCYAFENSIKTGMLESAKKEFQTLYQEFPDFFTEQEVQVISENLENLINFKPKNQMLAAYLSILPGLGQLYAGDYKDSLNAFLLNGSIIAVSVYSIYTLDFWTFSLIEFNPLIHFMKGNMYNAQKDVYNYNTRRRTEYEEKILSILAFHI